MSGRRKTGYVFLTCLIVSASATKDTQSCQYKNTGEIRGSITCAELEVPLVAVTVAVKGTSWGALSDTSGHFRIWNVPEGTYSLTISALGHEVEVVDSVVVVAGKATEVSRQLVTSEGPPTMIMESGVRVVCYYPGSLVGMVMDAESGNPIEGVFVNVMPGARARGGWLKSNARGIFRIEPIRPGVYDIDVTHPDYEDLLLKAVEFEEGVIVNAAFGLTRKAGLDSEAEEKPGQD